MMSDCSTVVTFLLYALISTVFVVRCGNGDNSRTNYELVTKEDCGGSADVDNFNLVKKVFIRNCSRVDEEGVCHVDQGTVLYLRVKFYNQDKITDCRNMTKYVFSYKFYFKLPLPLPEDEILIDDKFKRKRKAIPREQCQLIPRKKYAYNDRVEIKSFFPSGSYDVYWVMNGLLCFKTKVKVI